jgi:hypothetical protein
MTRAGVTDADERQRMNEINNRRQQVLQSILESPVGLQHQSALGPVVINKVDVPGRTRPPQADDPEDPFGLWDKTPPKPPPSGKFKDPMDVWRQAEARSRA